MNDNVYFLGPAFGVVVGNQIPVYTILGSTMDYAKTLTVCTPYDKIVVTDKCYQIIKDNKEFIWESIGDVECMVRIEIHGF